MYMTIKDTIPLIATLEPDEVCNNILLFIFYSNTVVYTNTIFAVIHILQ
jgi:hypothetical protein